jgi:phage tail protein X
MMTYTTKQNDVLDDVVFRVYGSTSGIVEQVLESNRALDLGQYDRLPAGLVIVFPDIEPPNTTPQPTRLWE